MPNGEPIKSSQEIDLKHTWSVSGSWSNTQWEANRWSTLVSHAFTQRFVDTLGEHLPTIIAKSQEVPAEPEGKTEVTQAKPDAVVPPPASPSPVGQRFAVVVGVSDYADTRIPRLRYAASDARAFHDWLVAPGGGGFAPANVRLLLDGDATYQNLKTALFTWLRQALEEDLVVCGIRSNPITDSD